MQKRWQSYPNYMTAEAMTANISGAALKLEGKGSYSFSTQWVDEGGGGSLVPVGNFTIEGSNDSTNWSTVPGSTVAAASAAGSHQWNFSGTAGYLYVRLVYTRTSGGTNYVASTQATVKE